MAEVGDAPWRSPWGAADEFTAAFVFACAACVCQQVLGDQAEVLFLEECDFFFDLLSPVASVERDARCGCSLCFVPSLEDPDRVLCLRQLEPQLVDFDLLGSDGCVCLFQLVL